MKPSPRLLAALSIIVFASTCASGQFYKIHNADVAVGGTGQFTTSITDQETVPHQGTTDSAGFLLSFRDHPVAWAGIEFNYGYSSFSERFIGLNSLPLASVALSAHEATAAYLFHPHFRKLQPFVGVGGGALYFHPYPVAFNPQWRGTGLFEIGADIPTSNPHLGFRVQARSLLYRAPNFNNSSIATSRWVATNEPSASVYVRF